MGSGALAIQSLEVRWTDVVTALSSAVLALFAAVAIWQILEVRRDRHFRVVSEVLQEWNVLKDARERSTGYTPSELKALVEINHTKDRTDEDRKSYIELMRVANFFEDVGGHVKQKALTTKVVARYLASDVLPHHARWEESIDYLQATVQRTNLMQFDQLAETIKKLRKDEPDKY